MICQLLCLALVAPVFAKEVPPLPAELSAYVLDAAPEPTGLLLQKGDRLAICGDSITEQKRYSVIIEAYLAACMPELQVSCRQYGWSGEQAGGFLGRMESDVLRFQPTIATSCYGMNDFRYVPFNEPIAEEYRKNETAMVQAFKKTGARVLLGSPGIIDTVPHWVKSAAGTKEDLNLALSKFRNIGIAVAKAEGVGFADVYRSMLLADNQAEKLHGPGFMVSGKDGVHPGWAGQVVMAYAFLKGMGLDGNIGTITYDPASNTATATAGHEVLSATDGTIRLRSAKLPFCGGPGDVKNDDVIRAGLALIPFDEELNRFILKIDAPAAANYEVRWGDTARTYSADQIKAGVNLAKDFETNPAQPAFKRVWDAVEAKQNYETRQIKTLVHGPEGAADREATFALTEKARAPLAKAIAEALQPLEHSISVKPL
ncbi:SGNH/GDSL hydrolase family protein [Luteolibacter sp. GHJ8]|uniref:SGNH/GDSL hydrolase family protein n=1 Tax=Luteolibacter rhizosphaerae TaxID=2989719 RepID=A0ABT3G1M4_9BACT|nr:SGNH/GDSL hydrolase family protein [Luteolibacter rhizosphaerae]MCW1913562.1 SGNH/GDSL hydrolase family protein [Luteolibacter rhizosphaerae]